MKTLLLSDIPPSKEYTAGLFLDQLVRLLPQGSVCCYTIESAELTYTLSSYFESIPFQREQLPNESQWIYNSPWRMLPFRAAQLVFEAYIRWWWLPSVALRVADYAYEMEVQRLWCVLESPALLQVAYLVARILDIPYFSQVLDPPHTRISVYHIRPFFAERILRDFDRSVSMSLSCATGSWNMADDYQLRYGVRTTPVIPSLSKADLRKPARAPSSDDELVIGMAGQLYALDAWISLLCALDQVNWVIAGRKVKIRILSNEANLQTRRPACIEFLGWRPQQEALEILAQTDVLYLPYRFSREFDQEIRLSFPSKLTSYLTVGRPIFFHGPEMASPGQFLAKHEAGMLCYSISEEDILAKLTELVENQDLYCKLSHNAGQAFVENLTFDVLRRQFARFLGVHEASLNAIE